MDSPNAAAQVTVVISTLNRPVQLARCLDALLAGTVRPAAVVVVNQGAAAEVETPVSRARHQGLSVSQINQPRLGLSVSQNTGVRAAGTPVVAIIDDDCVADPRWVEVVASAFGSTHGPLLLTGRVLALPPEGERVLALSVRDSRSRSEWSRPPMPWHLGTGGNFAVTRDAFLTIGGNDERLGTGTPGRGANDLDLFYRLVRSGVLGRYEPDLVVLHERATLAEFTQRLGGYGHGLGAMLGIWLRRGDLWAIVVLAAWVRLRVRVAYAARARGAWREEAQVLTGTVTGLRYGLLAKVPAQGPHA